MTLPFFADLKAIVFDAVGTLLEPTPSVWQVYATAAQTAGGPVPEASILKHRFVEAFQREEAIDQTAHWQTNEPRERARWQAIVRHCLQEVPSIDAAFAYLWQHFAQPSAWRVPKDAETLLTQLHGLPGGPTLAIGSNFDARLRSVVAGFPALVGIPILLISSELGVRKPAAAYYAHVRNRLGCSPEQILILGDDLANDYQAPAQLGYQTLLYDPFGRHPDIPKRIDSFDALLR